MYSPREDWSQRSAKRVVAHPLTANGEPVSLLVLHHTVTRDSPFFDVLRSVERFHLDGKYYDIAYNGAASNSSDDWTDLRGPLVQGGATGRNAAGHYVDGWSLSIVVPGDFQTRGKDNPRPVVVENVARLIVRWINDGHVNRDFRLEPHRAHYQTSCCGDRLLALIPDIVTRVHEILGSSVSTSVGGTFPMMSDWRIHYNQREHFQDPDGIVEWFQRGLVILGFLPAEERSMDGVKGPATDAAVVAWETSLNYRNPNATFGAKSFATFLERLEAPRIVEEVEVIREVEVIVEVPVEVEVIREVVNPEVVTRLTVVADTVTALNEQVAAARFVASS